MLGPVLFVCLATAALAQLPHPCTTPEQWEGQTHSYDPDRQRESWARIFYDHTERRFREIEKIRHPDQAMAFDVLVLHNENLMYVMDLKTKECNLTTLDRPFFPFGVPPSANFTGTATIGAAGVPNEHIIVNIFTGMEDNVEYSILTSSPDCYPLTASHTLHHSTNATAYKFAHREFYDIVPGISDPMAFIPPVECLKLHQ